MVKKGDTLIEVTIAIGIFSMIAIAIASVMSSGTSGSQMALETTLAREEINAQAEALRFVHSSYISSRNYKNEDNTAIDSNPYANLWTEITTNAIDPSDPAQYSASDVESATQFEPSTCDELYNKPSSDQLSPIQQQKAFILDITHFPTESSSGGDTSAYASSNDPNYSSKFVPTTTYPRLVFGTSAEDNDTDDSLIKNSTSNLYEAAGLYIIAIKDSGTKIGGAEKGTSSYYDFYIRACWYGTDATRPSTISTVVRLYNPNVGSSKSD